MNSFVKPRVLPIYFTADESYSMKPFLDVLNQGLRSLYDAMQSEPLAASKVRFSVIGFSEDTTEYLSRARLTDIERETMPVLKARTATNYARVFEDLFERIPRDVAALRGEYAIHRPAVFFLTDGEPTSEGWEAARAKLQSLPEAPNVLAFGVEGANEAVLSQLASQRDWAFIATDGAKTGEALLEFMVALTQSVVASGHAIASGNGELIVQQPASFHIAAPLL